MLPKCKRYLKKFEITFDDFKKGNIFLSFKSHSEILDRSVIFLFQLHPEQNDYNNFILAVTQPALLEDSMKTTHSLHVNIQSETHIEQVFDDIEYEKGASILRMLNITLTERVFQKGLRTYLKNWLVVLN